MCILAVVQYMETHSECGVLPMAGVDAHGGEIDDDGIGVGERVTVPEEWEAVFSDGGVGLDADIVPDVEAIVDDAVASGGVRDDPGGVGMAVGKG